MTNKLAYVVFYLIVKQTMKSFDPTESSYHLMWLVILMQFVLEMGIFAQIIKKKIGTYVLANIAAWLYYIHKSRCKNAKCKNVNW